MYQNKMKNFFCESREESEKQEVACHKRVDYNPANSLESKEKRGQAYDVSDNMMIFDTWTGKVYSQVIDLNKQIKN